ncbi:asparagine synthetase B family protein [Selenomonas sp. AE3005]|uniref:asparagine synthase-related protein n=1 Tax=Selenomonas sp. AE3005 TaxID=1485543 RepID=UPI000481D451|nr:asparagine synthetase B family protein [Selenomonas sp. AE3005]
MLELHLTNNRAFAWQQAGNVWTKGFLFASNGRQYVGVDLPEFFLGIETEQDFAERLREANGSFCVAVKTANGYMVAVDRLRSMLMFVAQRDGRIIIGDDANALRDKLGLDESDLDALKVEELRQSGYTVGSHTIYKSIAQLCGGEYAVITENNYSINYYYEHTHGNFMTISKADAFQQLDGISERMFKRLIESVDGRQIVVPLSGGYDSRYIVAWLKKLGYENVCCFTYGRRDSFEVQISHQVAKKLNYEWHFVEYTDETWQSIFAEEWRSFYEYSGQLSQLPHCQDIYAIKTLLERGIIHKDSVVVPGYCGDVLGGSFLVEDKTLVEISKTGLAMYINKCHFNFMQPTNLTAMVVADIESDILKDISVLDSFNSEMEEWLTKHRWSKFIVNALRGYDYFGLEWRMPLWDNELMEFWYRVPNEHRSRVTWYDEYLLTGVFKEYDIDIVKDMPAPQSLVVSNIKRLVKKSPLGNEARKLHTYIRRKLGKVQDFNQTSSICNYIKNDSRVTGTENIADPNNVNAFLVQWYLQKIIEYH